jgi:ABC-type polysaccharide/polyol phosphate transport system ATPase subunit
MADQVEKMCDRVIWLENSKIVAEGDSKEITSAYTESVLQARKNGIEHQA